LINALLWEYAFNKQFKNMKKISYNRIGEYLQTAFKILIENGGSFSSRGVMNEMEKRLNFNEYEKERYEKTGYIRWQSITHFYSVDCNKADWLKKSNGVWSITPEGEKALSMGPEEFIKFAMQKYKEWKKKQNHKEEVNSSEDEIEENVTTGYEQAVEVARREIEEYIRVKGPYEFQDLCAALLRGMGYYTPFIAPRGPDRGIDIIAYKDPLGAEGARIKVQVKHRADTKVSREEVAQLGGIIRSGEVGLIISSGGFSKESLAEMRSGNNHIEKMDLNDFIVSWERYYDKLSEEDKVLMPFRKIAFLAPQE